MKIINIGLITNQY